MTERKSTEIKIRVTPSEKARWQADSEREGVSLSELICRRMNFSAALALQKASFNGSSNTTNFIPAWTPESYPAKVHKYSDTALAMRPYSKLAAPAERRKEPCSHSRPPYAFCAECDR